MEEETFNSAAKFQAKKFLAHYKCECLGSEVCNCPQKSSSKEHFLDNVHDVAFTLADVMMICGIHEAKAKAAVDLIVYAFLHYDEIRHKIDAAPQKRLCKEDLIHDLGRKCLMTRLEAQLTYSIVKRAFKAFYHGTTEGGIRNRALEADLLHSQECMWVHAAKRTAQIFARYEGMFFNAQKTYESEIRCAYKQLYDKFLARKLPFKGKGECQCEKCFRKRASDLHSKSTNKFDLLDYKSAIQLQPVVRDDALPQVCPLRSSSKVICSDSEDSVPTTNQTEQKVSQKVSKIDFQLPRCYKCNCPKLICDCDVDRDTGVVSTDCSQGPYKCQWIRMDAEDEKPDPCITIPENHQCPVDCETASMESCDSECECDCSESCECVCEDMSSGYDYYSQDEATIEDEVFEVETEDQEEPPLELPDISNRKPNAHFGGCHIPVRSSMVEETTVLPTSIAQVQQHRQESFVRSEPVRSQTSLLNPNAAETTEKSKTVTSASAADKQKGPDAIAELSGQL